MDLDVNHTLQSPSAALQHVSCPAAKNRGGVMKETDSGFVFNLLLEWRKTSGVKVSTVKDTDEKNLLLTFVFF